MGVSRNRFKVKPQWSQTLGDILDNNAMVRVHCQKCLAGQVIDVAALAEKVGRGYSLWNRRCRCRLTPGCQGWNVFSYSNGTWFWNYYDRDTADRWFINDP